MAIYDDRGIRFEYPDDWELEVSEDGPKVNVGLQSPGAAFAFVSVDESKPDAKEEADQALVAMKEEYPNLEASAASETIAGLRAVGYDLEFFSLDVIISCIIRCVRSPGCTILVFAQWPDLEGDEAENAILTLRQSLEDADLA